MFISANTSFNTTLNMKLFPYVVDKATTISGRLLLPCTSTIEQSAPVFSLGLAMLWSMGQEQLWYKQS